MRNEEKRELICVHYLESECDLGFQLFFNLSTKFFDDEFAGVRTQRDTSEFFHNVRRVN